MSLVLLLLLLQSSSSSSLAAERMMVGAPKNIPNSNSVEIRELANFAVSQYNSGKVCMLLPPSSSSSSWYECSYNLFCSQDPILACGNMLVWKLWRREVCYDWSHTQMKHCECKTGPLSLSLSIPIRRCNSCLLVAYDDGVEVVKKRSVFWLIWLITFLKQTLWMQMPSLSPSEGANSCLLVAYDNSMEVWKKKCALTYHNSCWGVFSECGS